MKSRAGAWALAVMAIAAAGFGSAEEPRKPAEPNRAEPKQAEPKQAEPFYRKYLIAGNKLDDSILEQEKRVEADPQNAGLRNDLGNLLAERRFPKEAAEQYETAARLDKTNFISLYNLGLLRETEGKISSAIRAYQKSIERKRGFPQSHFRLGRLFERVERSDRAVEEYSKALWIDRTMRDPKRNPLVVDSELLYRASLANYAQDVAEASMAKESAYVEESRFRVIPVDRALAYQEAMGEDESEAVEPRQIGPANAAGTATESPAAGPGRRTGSRPGATGEGAPMARPRAGQTRRTPRAGTGTPIVAVPPGSSVPSPPPPAAVEVTPHPTELEPPPPPPESMPEPTPAAPPEEEPS